MTRRLGALDELARLAAGQLPVEEALPVALQLIRRETGASAVFAIYTRQDDFDYFTTGPDLEMTQTAVWLIHQDAVSATRPRTFRHRYGRVVRFGDPAPRACDYAVLMLPSPLGRGGQMLLVRGPWRRGLGTRVAAFLTAAGPAVGLIVHRRVDVVEAERESSRISTLAEISRVISQNEDLTAMLTSIAHTIARVAGVNYVTIDVLDPDGSIGLRCVNAGDDVSSPAAERWIRGKNRPDPIRDEVLRSGSHVLLPDVQNDPRVPESGRQFFIRTLIRSSAVLPLLTKDGAVGTMSVASHRPLSFNEREVELLEGLADQVASAVHGVQLYHSLTSAQEALRRSDALMRATLESTGDGILVVNRDGGVAYFNGRFKEMWRIADALIDQRDDAALLAYVLDQLENPDVFLAKVQALYASTDESFDVLTFKDGRVFERYSRPLLTDGCAEGRVWSFRDVTARKRAEAALQESERNFRILFADNPHPMWVTDRATGEFLEVNGAAVNHYGYSRDEFLAMTLDDICPPPEPCEGPAHEPGGERRHALRDGSIIDVLVLAHDLEFGGRAAVLAVAHDITEQKRAEAARARLTAIIDATTDIVTIADATGRRIYLNAAGRRLLGISDDADLGAIADDRPVWAREAIEAGMRQAAQDGVSSGESAYTTADGRDVPVSQVLLAHKSESGRVDFYSVIARDISERKRFEAQLVHLADHDPLTGLFNRRRFAEELGRRLAECERYGVRGALLFIDLDQFKDINDSRGHGAGDEVLAGIAGLLRRRLRETDLVARLGGDEFAVVLSHTSADDATSVADGIIDAIRSTTFLASGVPVVMTASIGVALFPEHGTDAGDLLSYADLAMFQAKESGRNRFAVYRAGSDFQRQIEARIGWQRRIREALDRDQFVLRAQPILDLRTQEVTQYELLLRMDVEGTLVLPGAFLDVAERSGLIRDIDRWVVRRAIRLMGDYAAAGKELRLEVNLSGKAFADIELLSLIQSDLQQARINPANLVLEVTETAAVGNIDEAQRFVRTLKQFGCGFALDDFGVGFSSFSQLKHLPVDYLKIDGSFIRDLSRSAVDRHLVKAIVDVARGLGKQTIAEFADDPATLKLLEEFGVDYAQGFYVGLPGDLPPMREPLAA